MNKNLMYCQKKAKRTRYKLKKVSSEASYRISIFKSNKNLYAQIIDDSIGHTLIGISTANKDFVEQFNKKNKANKLMAQSLGKLLYEGYQKLNLSSSLIFDRGPNKYCGVIKSFADSLRNCGMKF